MAGLHRAEWQEWGRLAETVGHTGFQNHIDRLWADEPPTLRLAATVTAADDDVTLILGEMVQSSEGLGSHMLYEHRFPSAEARNRFLDWFHSDDNCNATHTLVEIGYASGTAALGEVLNDIAASAPAKAAARGRRRGRKSRMVA